MKRGAISLGLFAVLLAAGSARAAPLPVLQPAVAIQDGGADLVVDSYAAVEVVDWDNDGKKDLLVGQMTEGIANTDGKVMLFLNQGSNASPSFSGGAFLQAAGGDLVVPDG